MKKITTTFILLLIGFGLFAQESGSPLIKGEIPNSTRSGEFICEQDAVFSQVFATANGAYYAEENYAWTMVADDYLATAPFSSIRIWGANYYSGTFGATETFVIKIYDKNLINPAIPGVELHSFMVTTTTSGVGYIYGGEGYEVDLDFGSTVTLLDGWVSISRQNSGDGAEFAAYVQMNTGNMVQFDGSAWIERDTDLMFCLGGDTPQSVPVSNWAIYFAIMLIGTAIFYRFKTRIA